MIYHDLATGMASQSIIGIVLLFVSLAVPVRSSLGASAKQEARFFDAHVHFHAIKEADLDKVAAWMDENNISRIINHPLQQSRPKNEVQRQQMLKNYDKYKGKIYRTAIIEPQEVESVEEAIKILEREKADGAIGFGEHYGRDMNFDDPANMILFEACEKVGMPVMFHMDQNKNLDEKGLPRLQNALKKFPQLNFIAHSSGFWKHMGDGTIESLLKKYPNLYADISCTPGKGEIGKDKEFAKKFYTEYADKLLFGSDCGWWTFRMGIRPEFDFVDSLGLSKEVEKKILHGNVEKLFKLKK